MAEQRGGEEKDAKVCGGGETIDGLIRAGEDVKEIDNGGDVHMEEKKGGEVRDEKEVKFGRGGGETIVEEVDSNGVNEHDDHEGGTGKYRKKRGWLANVKRFRDLIRRFTFSIRRLPSARTDDFESETYHCYKLFPSDEDGGRWVAEPGVDKRASAYIERYHNRLHYFSVTAFDVNGDDRMDEIASDGGGGGGRSATSQVSSVGNIPSDNGSGCVTVVQRFEKKTTGSASASASACGGASKKSIIDKGDLSRCRV